jgi:hypothetical protein
MKQSIVLSDHFDLSFRKVSKSLVPQMIVVTALSSEDSPFLQQIHLILFAMSANFNLLMTSEFLELVQFM